ncbi:MAG: peptide chain release factor 2 [Candidatus Paraimprobicoccus trichonymphae]|uniref:Peptide chain release factor 2 n=1 Tax=Candidatus Paraimprobicoccus trichonymphae TaxID=3033793 RepID=A0AA48KWI5_9FIRM|nr:MAG: peptide chain release factor 2 [Candidatus Paraimprobicoccus trichonymphae]
MSDILELENIKIKLKNLKPKIEALSEALGLDSLKNKIENLEKISGKEDFWNDVKNAQKILNEMNLIKSKFSNYINLKKEYLELCDLVKICSLEEDLSLIGEIKNLLKKIEKNLEIQTLSTLLTGEYDSNDSILTLHAGAGGTEAQDWVEMLYRMYYRWAEKHKFKVRILDFLDGEEAGFKSISILIEGNNSYGFLKGENGVHRLVRISPFDSSGRRHTSFASIEVMPEIDNSIKVEISPEDIKLDVFRASGAGGQHVNKTSSAVRLTHIPTGIVVSCQNERSQHQNREMAMKVLKSKLLKIKEREHLEKIEDIKGNQKEITWGSQIRSYVFMPYTLVKDHRTGFEIGNVNSVMNGDLDGFITEYLKNKINC